MATIVQDQVGRDVAIAVKRPQPYTANGLICADRVCWLVRDGTEARGAIGLTTAQAGQVKVCPRRWPGDLHDHNNQCGHCQCRYQPEEASASCEADILILHLFNFLFPCLALFDFSSLRTHSWPFIRVSVRFGDSLRRKMERSQCCRGSRVGCDSESCQKSRRHACHYS